MVHVLVDDWLYMDIDGQPGAYGREETQRDLIARMKSVTAAFIDCETRIVHVPQEAGAEKETLINASFSNEYLIQEERLEQNVFQVTAAKKEKIKGIYQYFKTVAIKSLVPYPVGIRAFLASRALLPSDKAVIFVDDLKTQVIITIFNGLHFTAPRRISMRDTAYLSSEIKRSRQSFAAQHNTPFIIMCNNREWVSSFISQGLAASEEIIHVIETMPILEGLKTAKFGMNFVLPEELVLKKKRSLAKANLKKGLAGLLLILLVLGSYIGMRMNTQAVEMRLHSQELERQKALARLRELHQQKFKSLFSSYAQLPYERLYYDLIEGLPADYMVKEFKVQQLAQEKWGVTALLYPATEALPYKRFKSTGMMGNAQIKDAVVNKSLGQGLDLEIDKSRNADIDIASLPDGPVDGVDLYYRKVYERLNLLTGFHGIKRSIEVNGLGQDGTIASAAQPSQWEGIRKVSFKVGFYDVMGKDRYMRILRSLEQLRHEYMVNIITLEQSGNNVWAVIEVYGR